MFSRAYDASAFIGRTTSYTLYDSGSQTGGGAPPPLGRRKRFTNTTKRENVIFDYLNLIETLGGGEKRDIIKWREMGHAKG